MKGIVQATAVAGTLDILAAAGLTVFYGKRGVDDMLRFVASGPFPGAPQWGVPGALLGLVVHFALMAIMAWAYFWAARQWPGLTARPLQWGVIYGIATFVVMNLLVVPIRFGAWPPKPVGLATQLFCHVVLVGLPIALIAGACPARPRRLK